MVQNKSMDLKGTTVSLEWYLEPLQEEVDEMAASIFIVNIKDDMDEDYLMDVFSNERRTGGGEVTDLQIINANRALVTFADPAGKRFIVLFGLPDDNCLWNESCTNISIKNCKLPCKQ